MDKFLQTAPQKVILRLSEREEIYARYSCPVNTFEINEGVTFSTDMPESVAKALVAASTCKVDKSGKEYLITEPMVLTLEVLEVLNDEAYGTQSLRCRINGCAKAQSVTSVFKAAFAAKKQAEPKQAEPKQAEPKQAEPKQAEPTEPKQAEPKQAESAEPTEQPPF